MKKVEIQITEQEIKDLKLIRNYFGEHDVSPLEHLAYSELDKLIKKLEPKGVSDKNLRNELLKIGFKDLKTLTKHVIIIGDSLVYDLGRKRQLNIACLGTPNEIVLLSQLHDNDNKKITDCIVLRNYDYDGYTTLEDLKNIITSITKKTF